MSILLSIEELLSGRSVEKPRLELREKWEPKSVLRSICAFANDFENEGSGYIVIGAKEEKRRTVRPVTGFDPKDFDHVYEELTTYCNLIKPVYIPKVSLEKIDDKHVMVIWVPGGSNRPYGVPDDVLAKYKSYNYRIRRASKSVVPNEEEWLELIQLTAKTPFDDRISSASTVENLEVSLMKEHLQRTQSSLYEEADSLSVEALATKMNLCQKSGDQFFPKNVGLLMFSEDPGAFIPGAHIDLVEFPEGLSGKEFFEKSFTGPIQKQLTEVLSYFRKNILKSKVIKFDDTEESGKVFNYPFPAVEEAISNAVYHKNYESQQAIEVRVLPSRLEIISYTGVHPSLNQLDFEDGLVKARRYRNRRIGELLKELRLTEGRGTGIATISRALRQNGSEQPKYDTNEPERAFFLIELPIHPSFLPAKAKAKNKPHPSSENNQESTQEENQETNSSGAGKKLSLSLPELLVKVKQLEVEEEKQVIEIEESEVRKYAHLARFLTKEQMKILKYSSSPKRRSEIMESCLRLTNQTKNFNRHIAPLLTMNLMQRTFPDKRQSKHQKYVTSPVGKIVWYIKANKK